MPPAGALAFTNATMPLASRGPFYNTNTHHTTPHIHTHTHTHTSLPRSPRDPPRSPQDPPQTLPRPSQDPPRSPQDPPLPSKIAQGSPKYPSLSLSLCVSLSPYIDITPDLLPYFPPYPHVSIYFPSTLLPSPPIHHSPVPSGWGPAAEGEAH